MTKQEQKLRDVLIRGMNKYPYGTEEHRKVQKIFGWFCNQVRAKQNTEKISGVVSEIKVAPLEVSEKPRSSRIVWTYMLNK